VGGITQTASSALTQSTGSVGVVLADSAPRQVYRQNIDTDKSPAATEEATESRGMWREIVKMRLGLECSQGQLQSNTVCHEKRHNHRDYTTVHIKP